MHFPIGYAVNRKCGVAWLYFLRLSKGVETAIQTQQKGLSITVGRVTLTVFQGPITVCRLSFVVFLEPFTVYFIAMRIPKKAYNRGSCELYCVPYVCIAMTTSLKAYHLGLSELDLFPEAFNAGWNCNKMNPLKGLSPWVVWASLCSVRVSPWIVLRWEPL
jgi:hypothetical protein